MTTRLLLICHASTRATRRAAFPADEPLDARGLANATAARKLGRADEAWCGPSLRTRQTAAALGLAAEVDHALRECDFGHWQGRSLTDLETEEPVAIMTWMTDPAAAPHGGESVLDLLQRVGAWLDAQQGYAGRVIAVTHAAVIRAAIVHAIRATPASFWRIDIAPLSQTILHGQGNHWTLHVAGQRLQEAPSE